MPSFAQNAEILDRADATSLGRRVPYEVLRCGGSFEYRPNLVRYYVDVQARRRINDNPRFQVDRFKGRETRDASQNSIRGLLSSSCPG